MINMEAFVVGCGAIVTAGFAYANGGMPASRESMIAIIICVIGAIVCFAGAFFP
jgi:hypothetical protein